MAHLRRYVSRAAALCLALAMVLSLAGCNRPADSTAPATDGSAATSASGEPAPSMITDPSFTDPFDGSYGAPGSISAAVVAESNYEGEWGPAAKSNPTATESGGVLTIGSVTEYKGYAPSMLSGTQGTFEMLYTPADDVLSVMQFDNRPEWSKFASNDPPGNGFLLDTIGWRAAPAGSYAIVAGYTAEAATISWGIWDGSMWHTIAYSPDSWANRPMRITASYGPAGVLLFVDGVKVAEDTSYTGGIDTAQPFTLGQAPWYWPYGPHSSPGEIREFRYADSQVTGG